MNDIFLTEKVPEGIKEFLLDKEMPLSIKDIYSYFISLEWKIIDIVTFINHIESNYPSIIKNIEDYLQDDLFRIAVVPINLQEITKMKDVISSLSKILSHKSSKDMVIDVLTKNSRDSELDIFEYMLDSYSYCSLKIFDIFNTKEMIKEKEHLKLN